MINACAEAEDIAEAEHWLCAMEEDVGVKERMILHVGKEDASAKIAEAQSIAYSTMMKALVKSEDFVKSYQNTTMFGSNTISLSGY